MDALVDAHTIISENTALRAAVAGRESTTIDLSLSIIESDWQDRYDRLTNVLNNYGMSDDETLEFITDHAFAPNW
jgi:hypothetical protein